ncbi:hypothetical protein AOLI_G00187350 [Acnodon oligacanthus]
MVQEKRKRAAPVVAEEAKDHGILLLFRCACALLWLQRKQRIMGSFCYFAVLVLAAVCQCDGDAYFNSHKTLNLKYLKLKWMKCIPDHKPLSSVSIPGTHQSLKSGGLNEYKNFQAWKLLNQLHAGVRFVDMTLWISFGKLYVENNAVISYKKFSEALNQIQIFLKVKKSETVLLRLAGNSKAISRAKEELNRVTAIEVWKNRNIPTMGEARGKIVLIQGPGFDWGLPVNAMVLGKDKKNKEFQMKANIKKASEYCTNEMMLTDTGAKGTWEIPRKVAEKLNNQLAPVVAEEATDHGILLLFRCACAVSPTADYCLFYKSRAAVCQCDGDAYFNSNPTLKPKYIKLKWMKCIPDHKPLSSVSIPGTHQSLKRKTDESFQAWGFQDQLHAGVRFVDMTLWKLSGKLYVENKREPDKKFSEALNQIQIFLKVHKSETVLLRLAGKSEAISHAKEKLNRVTAVEVWKDKKIPTMGEARRKIVLIQGPDFDWGLPVKAMVLGDDEENKEFQMKANIKKASEYCTNEMMLTDTGAKDKEEKPQEVAEKLNNQLGGHLMRLYNENKIPSCLGIIAVDFPGPKLIELIINISCSSGSGSGRSSHVIF